MKNARRIIEDEKLRDKILAMIRSDEFSVMVQCLKEIGKRPPPAASQPEHALVLGALANAEVFGWQNCIERAENFDVIIKSMMQSKNAENNERYDFGADEVIAADPLTEQFRKS